MDKRQDKKNSKTAMHLLMQLEPQHFTPDVFSKEDSGIWHAWWKCGGYDSEWDCEPAYDQLETYLFNNLSINDFELCEDEDSPVRLVWEYTPDLSTAKKVFDLAKKLIQERGVNDQYFTLNTNYCLKNIPTIGTT